MISVWLIIVSFVWTLLSSFCQPQQLFRSYYKQSDKETYEVDYEILNYKVRFPNITVDIPPETDTNYTKAGSPPIQKNFNIEDYLIQSISPNDCRPMTNISRQFIANYGGNYARINPRNNYVFRGNVTRVLKAKEGALYMVNLYTRNGTAPNFYSKIDTLSIKYNATHINEIKEVDSLVLKFDLPNGPTPSVFASLYCLWAEYIINYKETVYLCMRYRPTSETDSKTKLVLYRPNQLKEYEIGDFPWFDTSKGTILLPPEGLLVAINATPDENFEIIVCVQGRKEFWSLSFNSLDVFNIKSYTFQLPITAVDYTSKILLILHTEYREENSQNVIFNAFYMERYPGSKITLSNFQLFSDSKPLRVHYSSESIEVVVEAFKFAQYASGLAPGFFPAVRHSKFSYNLITKRMKQISVVIYTIQFLPQFSARIWRIDSLSGLDTSLLLISSQVFNVGPGTLVGRFSLITWPDKFMGFGANFELQQNYNLYNLLTFPDPSWSDSYWLMPFGVVQKVPDNSTARCELMRQRMSQRKMTIKNTLNGSQFYPLLDIKIRNRNDPTAYLTFSFEFIPHQQLKTAADQLWVGSNITEIEFSTTGSTKSVPLSYLVRGSFIQRDFPNNNLPYAYIREPISKINELNSYSFFKTENLRLPNGREVFADIFQYAFALGRSNNYLGTLETVIILKTMLDPRIQVYLWKDSELVFQNFFQSAETIKKVLIVEENLYLLVTEEGIMLMFEATKFEFKYLPFPGVNCIDIELFYYAYLKPSLVCLNQNFKFTFYYIEELLARSLSNSMVTSRLADHPAIVLTKSSRILTTDFYPGLIFVVNLETKQGRPNLFVYSFENTEFPVVSLIGAHEVTVDPNDTNGIIPPIIGAQLSNERLVLHMRASDINNWIVIYKFSFDMTPIRVKCYEFPREYEVRSNATMLKFYEHKKSFMYINDVQPSFVLPILQAGSQNLIVIDPFSPHLETLPTLILPRNSMDHIFPFPFLVAEYANRRYYTLGILHMLKNAPKDSGSDKVSMHLFQLVYPGRPNIYITLDNDKILNYKQIFSKNSRVEQTAISASFTSHLRLRSAEFANGSQKINKEFNVTKSSAPMARDLNASQFFTQVNVSVESMFKSSKNGQPMNLVDIPFYKMVQGSVFDWTLVPESVYDALFSVFTLKPPIEEVASKQLNSFWMLKRVERVCSKYKKDMNSSAIICSRYGWVFVYEDEVEVYLEQKFEELKPERAIRVPFNSDRCTEPSSLNHSLFEFCLINGARSGLFLNVIDLGLQYFSTGLSTIYPRTSIPKKLEFQGAVFLSYSNTILDENNNQGVSKIQTFLHRMNYKKEELQQSLSPFNNRLTSFSSLDLKVTDAAPGATYIKNRFSYRFSSNFIHVGNKISIQFFEFAYYFVPAPFNFSSADAKLNGPGTEITNSTTDGTPIWDIDNHKDSWTTIVMGLNVSDTMRVLLLDKTSINSLMVEPSDLIQDELNSTFRRLNILNLHNYHAYIMSHRPNFTIFQASIYKLVNPFATLENLYWSNEPQCYRWVCILVSQFEQESFVRIYDVEPDNRLNRSRPDNFFEAYGLNYRLKSGDNYLPPTNDVSKIVIENISKIEPPMYNDLEALPEKYWLYPIQVYNATNLRYIYIDKVDSTPEEITVYLFSTPNTMKKLRLRRNFNVEAKNIYFASNYLVAKARSSFLMDKEFTLNFVKFREADYYKYAVHLMVIFSVALVTILVYFNYLSPSKLMSIFTGSGKTSVSSGNEELQKLSESPNADSADPDGLLAQEPLNGTGTNRAEVVPDNI